MLNFLNIREHLPEYHKDKSLWAYLYCYNIKDKPEAYKLINDSNDAYNYCTYIKDRPEVRKHITDSYWASCYRRWKKKQC